jgi:hypothetical protein
VESRKRKRSAEEEGDKEKVKEVKIDYSSTSRPFAGGPHYNALAVVSLLPPTTPNGSKTGLDLRTSAETARRSIPSDAFTVHQDDFPTAQILRANIHQT